MLSRKLNEKADTLTKLKEFTIRDIVNSSHTDNAITEYLNIM